MNSKGYTLVEMGILIAVVGVAMLLVLLNTSYAFVDNGEVLYESKVNTILAHAEVYGETSTSLSTDGVLIVTVNELIESGTLIGDENGEIVDPRDESDTLNDMEILLKIDSEGNIISTVNE